MEKYCWTHGGYVYELSECTREVDGHQNHSIFTNIFDGSWGIFTIQWKDKTKDDYISYKYKVNLLNNSLNF